MLQQQQQEAVSSSTPVAVALSSGDREQTLGRLSSALENNGEGFYKAVHILVAMAFIPNPESLPTVQHKDGDRTNNKLANLMWMSFSDQNRNRRKYIKGRPTVAVDQPGEHWKSYGDIQVSNFGRIKRKGQLVNSNSEKAYLSTTVEGKQEYVHHIVAHAFVQNDDPGKKTVVNHIDGNTRNNAACNLEWCTYRENSLHAYATGLNQNNSRKRPIIADDPSGKRVRFESVKAAAAAMKVTPPTIGKAIEQQREINGHVFDYE
jgi:hypothetical protein